MATIDMAGLNPLNFGTKYWVEQWHLAREEQIWGAVIGHVATEAYLFFDDVFKDVDGALNPAPEVLLELAKVFVEPILDFIELEELEVQLGEEEDEPDPEEVEQTLDDVEPALQRGKISM